MANISAACQLQTACRLILAANVSCGTPSFAVDAQMPQRSVIPDGYTAFPDIGVAYKYFNSLRPWDSARKLCLEEGGSLAVVDTFQKIDHIMRVKPSSAAPYIGIHRHFDFNEWTGVKTGLPVRVGSWAPIANFVEKTYICSSMWSDGRGISPDVCNLRRTFICEIPLSVN